MSSFIISRQFALLAVLFLGSLLPSPGQDGAAKGEPRLSFVCISSLVEDQEVFLASKDAAGEWQESGAVHLRSSSITEWIPAKTGELHLALKGADGLKPICSFTYPADTRRALVVLNANAEKGVYEARLVDTESAGFAKGSILLLNLSPITGLVKLGPDEHKIEAGQQLVVKPTLEESGMYRLMASRLDDGGKPVLCHDRFVSGKADARGIVFLLPHKTRGLRVYSLPVFGSFE